jgi:hypothetical protein
MKAQVTRRKQGTRSKAKEENKGQEPGKQATRK